MEFLDYIQYPPRLPANITEFPPPEFKARRWDMQVFEFTMMWIIDRIGQLHNPPVELKWLGMFFHIHEDNGFKKSFITPIWPTTGHINMFICQIARWAESDGLKQEKLHSEC